MSTLPVLLSPSSIKPRRIFRSAWIPVLFAVVFVAFTSTTMMSGFHTQKIVDFAWDTFIGKWHRSDTGYVNLAGRKIGHFFGYGTIGLMFRRAWHHSLRAGVMALRGKALFVSSVLGIVSTFALASLDEWHQMYLPQRHGSLWDAALDAAGALFLTIAIAAIRALRRRRNENAARIIRSYSAAAHNHRGLATGTL
jgi:VanZ family protein